MPLPFVLLAQVALGIFTAKLPADSNLYRRAIQLITVGTTIARFRVNVLAGAKGGRAVEDHLREENCSSDFCSEEKESLCHNPLGPWDVFYGVWGWSLVCGSFACCGSLIDPCCTHRNCYKKFHFQVANVAGAGLRGLRREVARVSKSCGSPCLRFSDVLKLRKCIRHGRRGDFVAIRTRV